MTPEELKQMHSEYLPEIPPTHREEFRTALTSQTYWRRWQQLIADRDWNLQQAWRSFRHKTVGSTFIHRLTSAGISDGSAQALLDTLRQEPNRTTKIEVLPNKDAPSAETSADQRLEDLRKLVILAVPHLPEDHLREIRIPAGLVLELLPKLSQ